mmetsp:Transcript_9933/g.22611  ORF Transcript_9933/g.22611 Transcript_9933/m.22611 type:complete len:209 (+) Transcript_9933:510-1136(+)
MVPSRADLNSSTDPDSMDGAGKPKDLTPRAASDEEYTIVLPGASFLALMSSSTNLALPTTLSAMMLAMPSGVWATKSDPPGPPAFRMRQSTEPSRHLTAEQTDSWLITSSFKKSNFFLPVSTSSWALAAAAFSSFRHPRNTLFVDSFSANSFEAARPMPELAPVIRIVEGSLLAVADMMQQTKRTEGGDGDGRELRVCERQERSAGAR